MCQKFRCADVLDSEGFRVIRRGLMPIVQRIRPESRAGKFLQWTAQERTYLAIGHTIRPA